MDDLGAAAESILQSIELDKINKKYVKIMRTIKGIRNNQFKIEPVQHILDEQQKSTYDSKSKENIIKYMAAVADNCYKAYFDLNEDIDNITQVIDDLADNETDEEAKNLMAYISAILKLKNVVTSSDTTHLLKLLDEYRPESWESVILSNFKEKRDYVLAKSYVSDIKKKKEQKNEAENQSLDNKTEEKKDNEHKEKLKSLVDSLELFQFGQSIKDVLDAFVNKKKLSVIQNKVKNIKIGKGFS